jgi:hypothetical protein
MPSRQLQRAREATAERMVALGVQTPRWPVQMSQMKLARVVLGHNKSDRRLPKLCTPNASLLAAAERLGPSAVRCLQRAYVVESLVDDKLFRGKKVYLVRWQGFSEDEDSWEAAAEIKATAPVALVAYESLVASIQARHTTRPRTR